MLTIRPATADDAGALAAVVQSAYRGDSSRQGWTTEADLLDGQRADAAMVRTAVTAPGTVVLVAENPADGVVACCQLERRDASAYLGMFAVRPDRQGTGVGRAVLDAAEAQARGWGARRLELTVLNQRPELVAWYERCGFAMTGVLHDFPYGDERYGVPRRPDLVLQEMAKQLT